MADTDTWMPLYIGDWLGATQRLTPEQIGAYIQILVDYWRNGPPPDDDEVLRQITKLDKPRWSKARPVLSKMFQITNGQWQHKRVVEELTRAKEHAERRSKKAKAAAQARWNDATSNAPSIATSNAPDMLASCATPSPSPSQEESIESTPPLLHRALAFGGEIVRVNQRDFDAWEKTYHGIPDLRATLAALDVWLCDLAAEDHTIGKRWKRMVTSQLDKKHQSFLAELRREDDDEWKFTSPC